MPPNFVLLDSALPDIARLVTAMVQARDAVDCRPWSHPQEPTREEWWADVLTDPRAQRQARDRHSPGALTSYRLRDEPRATILVPCTKCDWKAAFLRAELIAAHGADRPLPDLLDHLAAPGCARLGSNWDRCGVHYVQPIEGAR